MTTDAQAILAAMRERGEKATKGPWTWGMQGRGGGFVRCSERSNMDTEIAIAQPCVNFGAERYDADGNFIAAARTDLPALVGILERALEQHHRVGEFGGCSQCGPPWPCPTVRLIEDGLREVRDAKRP